MRSLCLLGVFLMLVPAAFSQPGSDAPQKTPPSKKTATREDQLRLMRPGAEHAALARYAGAWEAEITMGSGSGAATAAPSRGTAEARMLVGGRFLEVSYQTRRGSDLTEGVFIVGYDSRHALHTLVAMDSFGNYFVTSRGKKAEEGGTKLRLTGTDDDPQMKALGYTKEFVHILDLRSDDEFAIEVWFVDTRTPARREFKSMAFTFRRKK